MSDAEYWKKRAKLAEDEVERLQGIAVDPLERKRPEVMGTVSSSEFEPSLEAGEWTAEERDRAYDHAGFTLEGLEALKLLMADREEDELTASQVAKRLISSSVERARALNVARRAGYSVDEHPDVLWLFERMLSDLNSGRQTIDFLSHPPKIPVEALPVGAVFTTGGGRLLEVKRERTPSESLVTAYRWDRNDEPTTIDRKQLVQPIGRVVFNSARKQVVLGLLELSQHALDQMVSGVPEPKQLGG